MNPSDLARCLRDEGFPLKDIEELESKCVYASVSVIINYCLCCALDRIVFMLRSDTVDLW